MSEKFSETRYTQFDYLGRLLQMEQRTPLGDEPVSTAAPRVSSYKYNFAGALIEETYPSLRVVKNEFEADGDLSRISGKANANAIERTYANGFSYTPDGKIQRLRLGNGRWESAKFNERLQVTELALGTSDGDGSLWKLGYEYGELNTDGSVNAAKNTGNLLTLQNHLRKFIKNDYTARMKPAGNKSVSSIYQLKISLADIKPVIWRRMLVSEQTTLFRLHRIIQAGFDWWNCHLHLFEIAGVQFSQPEFELNEEWETEVKNEKRAVLREFDFHIQETFLYEYDFGDSWRHQITFEQTLQKERGVRYPKCTAGERSRPPEDVGGAGGYEYFLEAIKNVRHPEHKQYSEWVGGAFDAEYFSLDETNERIWKAVRQS